MVNNRLLAEISSSVLAGLKGGLQPVSLAPGDTLQTRDGPVTHVFFVEDGLVSVLGGSAESPVETALVGSEGLVGTAVLLGGARSSEAAIVRVGGTAFRVEAEALREAMNGDAELRAVLLDYVHRCLVEAGQTIYASCKCTLEQRLSRWLAMAFDRLGRDELFLTHEVLAGMLGVRRPGVTVALHVLEGSRAIRSRRGRVTMLDRDLLHRLAGPSFGTGLPGPAAAFRPAGAERSTPAPVAA